MEDRKTSWVYNLLDTTVDKKGPRPAVTAPNSHELIGVNGQVENGITPFPGFKKAWQFEPTTGSSGTVSPGNQKRWDNQKVLDFHPFDIKIGSDQYGYGFVYRVAGSTGLCTVLLDMVRVDNAGNGTLRRNVVLKNSVPRPVESDPSTGAQMSVVVWGRFLYVFVEGLEPFSYNGTGGSYGTVTSNTGPGKRPKLLSPNQNVALGSITSTGDADRPGKGQIFLTEYYPDEITGANGTSESIESGPTQGRKEVANLQPGSYAFGYVLYNSANGRRSALSEIAAARYKDFDPDGSSSGGGGLSALPLHAALEIKYDQTKYDQAYVYRSVKVEDAGGTYIAGIMHLDNIITLADYSIGAGQSIYFYELDDKQLVRQDTFVDNVMFDEDMPKAGCAIMHENTLLCSNIKGTSASTTDGNRPDDALRGLGEVRWSSVTDICPELFSPQNKYLTKIPNNRIIAMEQVGPNVVAFSRDRQYLLRKENNIQVLELHSGYGVVNSSASETIGTVAYFMTLKGLKAIDTQAQLDDVKSLNDLIQYRWASSLKNISMAYDPAIAALFILNPTLEETFILWFNTAKVTSLVDTSFSFCKRGPWPIDNKEYSQMVASDWGRPLAERCFFCYNNGTKPALYITDHLRERQQTNGTFAIGPRLTLMPFSGDSVFKLSANKTTSTISLTTASLNSLDTTDTLKGYKVYVLKAQNRSLIGKKATISSTTTSPKTITLGSDHTELNGLVSGDVIGISPVLVRWVGYPSTLVGEDGMMVADQSFFRVRHFDSLAVTMTDVVNARTLPDSILTGVEGLVQALAYKGDDTNPSASGFTLDTSGNFVNAFENYEGIYYAAFESPVTTTTTQPKYGVEGSCLTPGFQIAYPDAEFTVLGVMVTGSIRGTVRSRRPS